jgi:hypothetical protein
MSQYFTTPKGTVLPFMEIKGQPYLKVMHRLVWFREDHPDWRIETEQVKSDDTCSVFKATIYDNEGSVIATAHGREDYKHFQDAIEKSESKAIGRALGFCGYGTQFAQELDESDRIVDSPAPNKASATEPLSANKTQDVNAYTISFGKFKGQLLKDVPIEEIKTYMGVIYDKAKAEGKLVTGPARDFILAAESFLKPK